jgi:hypothetical protein
MMQPLSGDWPFDCKLTILTHMTERQRETSSLTTSPIGGGRSERQPYRAPRLTRYGDVGALTKNVGSTSKNNDGGSGKSKSF